MSVKASEMNPESARALAPNATVEIGRVTVSNGAPIVVFAGPCQMESRAHALEMALALKEIAAKLGIGLIYKSSFDKANRTSLTGQRGIGLAAAFSVFAEIRETLGLPIVTDVHDAAQCAELANVVDVLQIPAFLCRSRSLITIASMSSVDSWNYLIPFTWIWCTFACLSSRLAIREFTSRQFMI